MVRRVFSNIPVSLVISLVVAAILGGLYLAGGLEALELLTLDLRLKHLPREGSAPVSFVLIDQNSLKNVGQWPFPRGILARVLEQVSGDGPSCILVDIDLSSAGPDPAEDRKLEQAVARSGKVVLAVQWDERILDGGAVLHNITVPRSDLVQGAMGLGGLTFSIDHDGAIRRMPQTLEYGEEMFRPLGVVGALAIDPSAGNGLPDNAYINFNYDKLRGMPVVPVHKVLEGDYEKTSFQGRIVLVGASAPELHDQWVTPVGVVPGVFIQAAVLETTLNGSWHTRQGKLMTLLLLLLVSIMLGILLAGTGWRAGLVIAGSYLAFLLLAAIFAARSGSQLQLMPLMLVPLLQYPLHTGIRASGAERRLVHEKQRTEAILELAELHHAESSGQDLPTIPLVLLKQILGFDRIILYLAEEDGDPPWRTEVVLDDRQAGVRWDSEKIIKVMEDGEYIVDRAESLAVYTPLRTADVTLGVLFTEGPPGLPMETEDVRLLLANAAQAAYLLQFRKMERSVRSLYTNSLKALIKALGAKDQHTGVHAELSQGYVALLGKACGLKTEQIEALHIGALLHDIGKIGIPDSILSKTGKLTVEEFDVMKKHPTVGYEIIKDLPFPREVKDIILCHHERYDGTGYPNGLAGEEIPLVARIFTMLDTYQALVGDRPYKKSVSEIEAISHMRAMSGTQFDPNLLSIFLSSLTYKV
jgi:ribonuclease P protein subunit RPR2